MIYRLLLVAALLGWIGCNNDKPKPPPINTEKPAPQVPQFSGQQAYAFVEKQVSFGPRVPKTPAHDSCAQWLVETFKGYGAEVQIQKGEGELSDGTKIPIQNIIAVFNPEHKRRVLLSAHWDTRSVADQDTVRTNEPILGADDGGSGVGVLLEVARQLQKNKIDLGVDIVLFDVEDQGESGSPTMPFRRETWCLGSQYWSKNPHVPGYQANFGILLDMVGSKGAYFPQEGISRRYAEIYIDRVWKHAQALGYGHYFSQEEARDIVDDHLFVNEIRKIPMLDIINLPRNSQTGFGHYWHTHKDNMDIIDENTLKAVGQTVLRTLYYEAAGVI